MDDGYIKVFRKILSWELYLENNNVMKKYDENYEDQYDYRKDEMKNGKSKGKRDI